MSDFEIENYKIKDIVDSQYDDFPVNVVDFKIHLQDTLALDKRVSRALADYRPEYAYYSYNSIDYARRRFVFTLGANGLVILREEYLAYYKTDDTLGTEFKIKHKSYDHTNVDELGEAIAEQVKLRTDIVNHIKSMILGVVQTLNPTFDIEDIVNETQPFFDEFTTERVDFIEIGSHDYRDGVAAIDLNTTPHTYLGTVVAAPTTTLRDYIVSMT